MGLRRLRVFPLVLILSGFVASVAQTASGQQDPPDAPTSVKESESGLLTEAAHNQVQCGRACAAMALERFDIPYSNAELEDAIRVDADRRVSAASVRDYLVSKGLTVTGVKTGPSALLETKPVAILYEQRPFVDGSTKTLEPHFVIVIAYEDDRVCLYNPDVKSVRTGWMSTDLALQYWTGEALFIAGPPGHEDHFAGRISLESGASLDLYMKIGRWVLLPLLPIVIALIIRRRLIVLLRARQQGGVGE